MQWLGDLDSNQDSMVQSHVCYRCTISHRIRIKRGVILTQLPQNKQPSTALIYLTLSRRFSLSVRQGANFPGKCCRI